MFAATLNCDPPNQLECLKMLTDTQILKAQLDGGYQWGVTVDKDLIDDNPLVLITNGKYNKNIPIIIGTNAHEGTLLAWITLNGTSSMSDAQYEQGLVDTFQQQFAPVVESWYQNFRKENGNFATFSQILGDFYIDCGAHWASKYMVNGSTNLWKYVFAHTPVGWPLSYLNATHTLELAFVFHYPQAAPFLNYLTPPEYLLSLQMITLWTAMATYHNPSMSGNIWPKYDSASEQVLMFDVPKMSITTWDMPICNYWLPVLLSSANELY